MNIKIPPHYLRHIFFAFREFYKISQNKYIGKLAFKENTLAKCGKKSFFLNN